MDLRQLRQFATIVESGSYRRAADILHIAQPALSVSIQKLERQVGVQLLARGARGVTATEAGLALLKEARRALFHADQARAAARRVALGESGLLRLGFVGSATYTLLPRCLPSFRERYPDVQLELREGSTVSLIDDLRAEDIDAAFVRGPLADEPGLNTWVIERDDMVAAVPVHHPLARAAAREAAATVKLVQLRSEPFVMYAPDKVPGLYGLSMTLCRQAGFAPRISQEGIQVQTLVSLVASGLGVALVPAATRAYSTAHVVFLRLADDAAREAVSLSLVARTDTSCAAVATLQQSMSESQDRTGAPG